MTNMPELVSDVARATGVRAHVVRVPTRRIMSAMIEADLRSLQAR
jgi:hypothetical protein